jgi:pimeloyl-ACP methyl ester carboxylesterase
VDDHQRRTIELGGATLSYLAWDGAGESAPVLHFAHATGLNAGTYVPLLSRLADRFRVRAWDARGHGFTTLPADPARLATWERYVRDLGRLLEMLDGGGPWLLAGHSMGATVSIELAATRPDLVRGVVAVDPPMIAPARVDEIDATRAAGGQVDAEIASRAERRRAIWPDRATVRAAYDRRGAFTTWPDEWLDGYLDGGLVAAGDDVALACAPAWEAATFRGVSTTIWQRMKALDRPLTLLVATEASTVAPEAPEMVARLAPHARQRVVEGATHFLPMEHPDIVIAEIEAMARSLGLIA